MSRMLLRNRRHRFALLVLALPLGTGACIHVDKDVRVEHAHGRRVVLTPEAPRPVGPYSQGIEVGGTLWCAGQIGMDPATGEMVPGGVQAETRQALANVRAVLAAAGMDFGDVVQAQVFLADIADYGPMNEVYAAHFEGAPPARAALQVGALPRGARVEILMTAVRRERGHSEGTGAHEH